MQLNQSAFSVAPKPPSLHWAIVLGLSIVTLNLFGVVWMLRQALFARQLDPPNRAVYQLALNLVLQLFVFVLSFLNGFYTAKTGQPLGVGSVTNLMQGFAVIMYITAAFQIRATLMKHYGIKLNAALTFFFNTYYFQYHLSKIAHSQLTPFAPPSSSAQAGPVSA
jgi:hypothetical protein